MRRKMQECSISHLGRAERRAVQADWPAAAALVALAAAAGSNGGALTSRCRRGRGLELHPPGVGGVPQQQAADVPMGQRVPVDAVRPPVLQAEAEVEVQVEDVEAVLLRQPAAVEVGLDDVVAQRGSQVAQLWGFKHQRESQPPEAQGRLYELLETLGKPPLIFLPTGMVRAHKTRQCSSTMDLIWPKNLCRFSLYWPRHSGPYLKDTEKTR
ncbi:hypothetical protein EYF80_052447 [Liparis tanakae]|uniref:Uncharacterized protein n=1 Tax=Liparis tanakae TaxID=230148 RepID=A0A4Z2F844_9TELE|nr:hypothetical protein EYF80_052447 [Liparis tanakae]